MRGLSGKIAAVTGGGSGIGRAAAMRLVEEGCCIAVLDRNGDAATAAANEIIAAGGKALGLTVDVANEAEVEAAFKQLVTHFGRLDILVANAGIFAPGRDKKVGELPRDVWDEVLGVNLTGMYLTLKYGVNAIRGTAGKGAVVVTGSPTGILGLSPQDTSYSASKAGVHGLARIMATDYAREGIRVNVVIPGFTLSPLVAAQITEPSRMEKIMAGIPLGRAAQPEEIGAAIAFLASDDASYMVGSIVLVDGGQTAI
ncbi:MULTISPECIES: SDR family NAD(P)-dependent oxidoreductase [unclassified Mesorhizobium]|uniref:SDR family NAD(P)-dependent oxidoreductase n=1 Tax=unclassified Mesorhizobium TaxID=325217 RepID=UPI00143F3C2F|nr:MULTISPECIES: SDR family NAD(P)-dependent oxidoreductase [unclassified Mesorhizobium]